jgi:hypothetical protein
MGLQPQCGSIHSPNPLRSSLQMKRDALPAAGSQRSRLFLKLWITEQNKTSQSPHHTLPSTSAKFRAKDCSLSSAIRDMRLRISG